MRNILVISLVFLLSMVCHAQKIATSELNGTKWKEISPTYDYCERGMTLQWTLVRQVPSFTRQEKSLIVL